MIMRHRKPACIFKKQPLLNAKNKKINPFDEAAMSDYAFRNSVPGNSVMMPKQRSHSKK
jgi:hypothetical protein